MDWMSQDLAARLSARAAQGIGAGLLTARPGIKAMEVCRPLPRIDGDKPRLGDFRRELIGQLKETLNKNLLSEVLFTNRAGCQYLLTATFPNTVI